jgi:hypothetical protein
MGTRPAQATYRRSWKNLLLDARYQLRFTLFLVAICALLMCMLGWWLDDLGRAVGREWPSVMSEAESATKVGVIGIQGNAVWDDTVKQGKIAALEASLGHLELVLVATVVLLSLALFVYGILMTHKVAGPLFKIGLYLDKVKAGKYDTVYNLRKGDQLMEFFDHFREAHTALRKVQERDVAQLKELVAVLEGQGSPELAAALDEVKAIVARKEAGLG